MNKLLVTLAVGSLSVLTSANAADVLFVTGSPDLEKSNASRVITQLVQEKVPDVEIVRTDKIKLNSPEDIERERNRVSNAKIIVFHYPVYWYQPPAVFKNYLDSVYTFGFAHNANGGLLTDKKLILSVTSGAPASAYRPGGRMEHDMADFQLPLRQFANLCGLKFEGMVYTGGYNLARKEQDKNKQETAAAEHAETLITKINQAKQ